MYKLSKAQIEWLSRLRDDGPQNRKSRTGYTCMQLGWTEWRRDESGNTLDEQITEKGLKVLEAHSANAQGVSDGY